MPAQRIDWNDKRHEQRGSKRVIVYTVTCAGCGYTRALRSGDAKKAERNGSCYRCSQKRKAAQGFKAMANLYGHRWAMRHVQAHHEAHPSAPELQMAALLDRLGVTYRREVAIATKASGRKKRVYLVDFMIWHDGREWALEVDGVYWHTTSVTTMATDKRKTRFLKRRQIPLLRVTDAALRRGAVEAEALVVAFLGLAPVDEPHFEMAV